MEIEFKAPKGTMITGVEVSEDKGTVLAVYEEKKKEVVYPTTMEDIENKAIKNVLQQQKVMIGALKAILAARNAWNNTCPDLWDEKKVYTICRFKGELSFRSPEIEYSEQLYFKTYELREKFVAQFKDLINQALPLL